MSHQECVVCDHCGKHEAMETFASNIQTGVGRIPVGWFAKRQNFDLDYSWLTYCSAICVALGEGSPPLMEAALDPASVTP